MKIKLHYDQYGAFWHGLGWQKSYNANDDVCPYLNLGFFAVDWFDIWKELAVYFWRFSVTFTFRRGK